MSHFSLGQQHTIAQLEQQEAGAPSAVGVPNGLASIPGSLRESFVHDCTKAYHKPVLWPRTAARRRPAARVGAVGIVHINYVLKSMRYHSNSRANGRAVGPESHRPIDVL